MRPPLRPTVEQLAPLSRTERLAFELADTLARPGLSSLSSGYNTVMMGALIWSCGGRRFHVEGLEHLLSYGERDSVLLVANHRSFFDFFSIAAIVYWRTRLAKRIFFPVRSTFFYDHPLGPAVNLAMSGMRMFPPMMRDRSKKVFNHYAVERCIDELNREDVGTVMGLHPEGTRNKGLDPYALLPAQPGVGRIALGAHRAKVIPAFVLGMGQSILGELQSNALRPEQTPIDMYFGAPIPFDDLRSSASMPSRQQQAADRCRDAIMALAERQRRDRAGGSDEETPPASGARDRRHGAGPSAARTAARVDVGG